MLAIQQKKKRKKILVTGPFPRCTLSQTEPRTSHTEVTVRMDQAILPVFRIRSKKGAGSRQGTNRGREVDRFVGRFFSDARLAEGGRGEKWREGGKDRPRWPHGVMTRVWFLKCSRTPCNQEWRGSIRPSSPRRATLDIYNLNLARP